jgi:hypothetical protein
MMAIQLMVLAAVATGMGLLILISWFIRLEEDPYVECANWRRVNAEVISVLRGRRPRLPTSPLHSRDLAHPERRPVRRTGPAATHRAASLDQVRPDGPRSTRSRPTPSRSANAATSTRLAVPTHGVS